MKEEALKLADELDATKVNGNKIGGIVKASAMIRRLVEELDKKQQGLVEASAMLFNYKYELDIERAMSAQLKEELDKQGEPIAWATEDLEEIMSPKIRQAHIDHPQSCTHKFFPIALYATPQTKPLSDEEIMKLLNGIEYSPAEVETSFDYEVRIARAIEERHGIK